MASKFESAFASARKAGKKTFSFNGKSYNTKVASPSSAPKSAPTPTSRQGQDKGSGGRATSASQTSRPSSNKVSAKSGASRSTAGKTETKIPYKRDNSFAPKATAAVAGVARDGVYETVKKAMSGSSDTKPKTKVGKYKR